MDRSACVLWLHRQRSNCCCGPLRKYCRRELGFLYNMISYIKRLTNIALSPPCLPYLITLCDPVSNLLQLLHGFFILEIIGEGFSPFLQELNDFGSEGF